MQPSWTAAVALDLVGVAAQSAPRDLMPKTALAFNVEALPRTAKETKATFQTSSETHYPVKLFKYKPLQAVL